MKKLIYMLFLILFFNPIYAQKTLYLRSPGSWVKDATIRSGNDTTTYYHNTDSLNTSDAFIYSYSPDSLNNYGNDSVGYIGNDTLFDGDSSGIGRMLIIPDTLTGFEKDIIIINFDIILYRDTTDTCFGTDSAEVYFLDSNWAEGNEIGSPGVVNWCSTGVGSMVWATQGGSYHATRIAVVPFSPDSDSICIPSNDSLISYAQNVINGTRNNYGFLLKTQAESLNTYFPIVTSDTDTLSGLRPKFIFKWYKRVNLGADTVMAVGIDTTNGETDTCRTLFQNDSIQAVIPSNATITSVRMMFFRDSSHISFDTSWVYLKEIDSSWSEGFGTAGCDSDTVNWINRLKGSDGGPLNWNSVGGDFNTRILDSVLVLATTDSIIFSSDSLKAKIQRIVAGTDSNRGFALVSAREDSNFLWWAVASDDSFYNNPLRKPIIDIFYTVPIIYVRPYRYYAIDANGLLMWVLNDSIAIGLAGYDSTHYIYKDGTFISTDLNILTPTQIDSSFYAKTDTLITERFNPEISGLNWYILSNDSSVYVELQNNGNGFGMDSSWYYVGNDDNNMDSIRAVIVQNIPSEFNGFWDSDSAYVINYWVEDNTTVNNSIEIDIYKFGSNEIIYNGDSIATNKGWNQIVLTGANLGYTFIPNEKIIINITNRVKQGYPLKLVEIWRRYRK